MAGAEASTDKVASAARMVARPRVAGGWAVAGDTRACDGRFILFPCLLWIDRSAGLAPAFSFFTKVSTNIANRIKQITYF
ncbi:hypothetical protein D3C81_1259570 [compost metagenome]